MDEEKQIKRITLIAKWLMGIMFLLIFGIVAGWLSKTMTLISVICVIVVVIIGLGQYKERLENNSKSCESEILTITDLLKKYADCPQEFEEFCAELFRKMGYNAKTTAKTNDGGYDLWMEKNGVTYIVECKLYTSDIVGRPLIQKLVGANATQKADMMVFITTSGFSKPAKEYAVEQKIWLINGEELQRMIDNYYY